MARSPQLINESDKAYLARTLDDTMRHMDEASKGGFTMKTKATVICGILPKDMAISDEHPTPDPILNAIAGVTRDWTSANKILEAINAGERWPTPVPLSTKIASAQIAALDELMVRMMASKADAKHAHAAWNPAEVVTQLKLEIETGKYEVGQ